MPSWLLVVLVVLATYRVTRLAVADEIPLVKVPRDKVATYFGTFNASGELVASRRWGRVGWSIAYLVGCPWCMSVWVGGALVWLTAWLHGLPAPWLVWLAASSVTGWAAQAESEHEQRWKLRQRDIDHGQEARR